MLQPHPIHSIQISQENLYNLKYDFRSVINSVRRLALIESITDLIDILWKRDEIGTHNIESLFLDSFCIFNDNEKHIIRDYVSQFDSSEYPISDQENEVSGKS